MMVPGRKGHMETAMGAPFQIKGRGVKSANKGVDTAGETSLPLTPSPKTEPGMAGR